MREPLDDLDRRIIDALQEGFPICERPYQAAAATLGLSETALIERLRHLLDGGVLSRFGPMYRIERAGGAVALAALSVPPAEVERVAALLNAMPAVAHNYERQHAFNLWFVLAVASEQELDAAVRAIEAATGAKAFVFPKEREYFLDLRLAA